VLNIQTSWPGTVTYRAFRISKLGSLTELRGCPLVHFLLAAIQNRVHGDAFSRAGLIGCSNRMQIPYVPSRIRDNAAAAVFKNPKTSNGPPRGDKWKLSTSLALQRL